MNKIKEFLEIMQSYLDVSMTIVIATAVVLLVFILVSFILVSRRCSVIEKENSKLKADLEKALKELTSKVDAQTPMVESAEKKSKVFESSLQYLTDKLQDLVDNQKNINSSFDNLSVKVEQQKKEFENNSVENQPIILAKRLLAQGMSVSEVVAKTNMPNYEVEMLAKVHNLSNIAQKADESVAATAPVETSPVQEMVASQIATASVAPKRTAPTHHIASMKARDAYGMGTKSALRRPR